MTQPHPTPPHPPQHVQLALQSPSPCAPAQATVGAPTADRTGVGTQTAHPHHVPLRTNPLSLLLLLPHGLLPRLPLRHLLLSLLRLELSHSWVTAIRIVCQGTDNTTTPPHGWRGGAGHSPTSALILAISSRFSCSLSALFCFSSHRRSSRLRQTADTDHCLPPPHPYPSPPPHPLTPLPSLSLPCRGMRTHAKSQSCTCRSALHWGRDMGNPPPTLSPHQKE